MDNQPTKSKRPVDSFGNEPSDPAWKKFHEIMARLNLKYGQRVEMEESKKTDDVKVG